MAQQILIKRGKYNNIPVLSEGELALTTDTKDVFIGTDSGNIQLEKTGKLVNNVRDFGAVGDGEADDTIAIQTAVDNAFNSGGGTVYFPAGEYKTTAPINLLIGVSIEGVGQWTSIIQVYHLGNGIQYLNGHIIDESGEVQNWGSAYQSSISNIGVRNMVGVTLDGSGRVTSFNPFNGVHMEGLRYVGSIKNVRVSGGFTNGIYLFGSYGASVICCEVHSARYGLYMEHAGNGVELNRIYCKNTGYISSVADGGGIYIENCTNVNVNTCIIESGVGSRGIEVINCKNIAITSCYFERQTTNTRSISVTESINTMILNCNFENTLGLEIGGCVGVSIKYNTFFGNSVGFDPSTRAIRHIGSQYYPLSKDVELTGNYKAVDFILDYDNHVLISEITQ